MKEYALYVGIVAGFCTAVSMLPQLIKMIKTKKVDDISFVMVFILLAGVGGWIWYGILKTDYPIIITNCFSFLVNVLVLIFAGIYKKNK